MLELEEIKKELTIDDMPNEDFKFLAEICGLDIVAELLYRASGLTFFVPQGGFKKFYTRRLLGEYDGTTISLKRLALKYKTTEHNIREILKAARVNLPSEGQMSLFE